MSRRIGLRGLASLCVRPTAGTSGLRLWPAPLRTAAMATPFTTSAPLSGTLKDHKFRVPKPKFQTPMPPWGQAQRGQAERGQAQRGEAQRGQAQRGEAQRGQAQRGQAVQPRRKKRGRDPKIINILRQLALFSRRVQPPPLRMARNRHLRHWTIHRAWLLYQRQQREARETALMQLHNSMSKACETLRATAGPGSRPEGYLYRVAMEKKGVWGVGSIPIEYARPQTETPARQAWNHDWKR